MLATSSADSVLVLWDLDGGDKRGRDGRPTPALHKRIQVRAYRLRQESREIFTVDRGAPSF